METKALKKQMGAAIAMVLVAAIALAASTFAWFVSNNTVKATTSTISAQSNAPFMNIKYDTTAKDSDLTSDTATIANKILYPATWDNDFAADKTAVTTPKIYQFETATALDQKASTENTTTRRAVGTEDSDDVLDKYAVKALFNISSKGTNLSNLKVTGASFALPDGNDSTGNANLDSALRVLVKCGENWAICSKDGVIESSSDDDNGNTNRGFLANTVTVGDDTQVFTYLYYEGGDTNIYTNNLEKLKAASKQITLTFTADAPNL